MSCLESFGTHSAEKVYPAPPDGGYGWFIVAGHFINIGIGYGFTKSFGVFFPYIKDEFGVDNTTTSAIFSIMMFFQYSGSLLGNIIYRKYGPRVTLWIGGILCSFGLALIALMKTLWSFYVGVGLFVGLGFSFVILVGSATISRFFKAKRPMAIAFAMTGVPIMSITFPLLYELVYNNFGLFGGILIIAGLQFHVVLGGTFFRPITLKTDKETSDTMVAKLMKAFHRLIKNPNFLLYSTSIALVISGKFMVNPFVKDFAVHNIGLDKYQPAMILSICSGIDIISRPLGGYICSTSFVRDKLGTFETFTVSVIGLGLVNVLAPLYVSDFASFGVYGILFGLCFGLTIGVEWSNVAELVDTDILSDAITFIQLETSIGVFVSPLLGGIVSDRTGDFSYVFYIAGFLLLSGAGCAGLVAVRRRCSIGEPKEDETIVVTEETTKSLTKSQDGFGVTGSMSLNVPRNGSAGNQTSGSKSVLGINIQVDPRRRSRTIEDREKVAEITDSVASLHA